MRPYGIMDMVGPKKAPINETRFPKMGMAEAITYAMAMTPKVHDSHADQCCHELLVRCFEPRRSRTKMYFAGS